MTPEERAMKAVREIRTDTEGVDDEMIPIVFSPIYQPIHDALRHAIAEEREACARIAENLSEKYDLDECIEVAAAIRART